MGFSCGILIALILVSLVAADLSLFGGFNHDFLPFLRPDERNAIIHATATEKNFGSVFRIFSKIIRW
jgi:hypothetical protein